jgi:corrinoid protein of di/trimethylamine methyltransferase
LGEKEEILQRLYKAVLDYDEEEAENAAQAALDAGIEPVEAITQGLSKGIRELGDRFGEGEAFLPDLMMGADTMKVAVDILESAIPQSAQERKRLGTVVIGTVKEDIHDLGKNLVSTLLTAEGFEVIDLGFDVPLIKFVDTALEKKADIIAASCLLSTTKPFLQDLIQLLKDQGVREQFKVMVGGGIVSREYADSIEADGYGDDAAEAVVVAKRIQGIEDT